MNHAKTYHTRQQAAILNFMSGSTKKYVTVSQIAAHLKEEGQPVGLTTIYRQLDKFEKDGIVHKIVLDGNSGACYQYTGEDEGQMLLKCEDCGGIIPMDCSHMAELYQHVLQEHQFRVNPHRTMFYGVCDNCLEQEKRKEQGKKIR
ncbi:MAG: transcriptional repressor [Lachnospiraceae bacterium]|nr:transcriptional repressor [Lachnospiraceae bacterium]